MSRLILLTLLFFPTNVGALQSGFPSQPLWVSSSSAIEGETIVVSAVVINDTNTGLRGTLVFLANETRIGAREFDLSTGKSQIHSIEWKPARGEYKVSARIEGTSATLSQKETPSLTVVVKEPPPPPTEIQKTITQVVQSGSAIASTSAPIIVETAKTISAQTEALRNAGIDRLEKYLGGKGATASSQPRGAIAGTSTTNTTGFKAPSSDQNDSRFSKLAHTAAAGGLFVLKNSALFYPILALLILGTLYILSRKIRKRPQND